MTCKRTGKIPYTSRAEANARLREMKRGGVGNGLDSYKCRFCGDWHLGTPPQGRTNKRRLRARMK